MRQSRSGRWLVSWVCGGALLGGFSADASSQEVRQEFDDTIHVVQRKPVLQKSRLDLTPRIGVTFNDSIYRTMKVGASANYHISEKLYVGGLFEWYDFGGALGGQTSTFDTVRAETSTRADAPVLNWAGGLEVGYKPLVGKFALVNRGILFYDIAVTGGLAYVNGESLQVPETSGVGATISVVGRVFLNQWLAVNIEVRDIIYSADLAGASGTLANVASLSGGLSLYLPTSFSYQGEEE